MIGPAGAVTSNERFIGIKVFVVVVGVPTFAPSFAPIVGS